MSWHPRNLTITQRLLALTALAMVPAAAVVIFYIISLHQQREREVHALALQHGQLASLEMERIISGAEGILHSLKHSQAVRDLASEGCGGYLAAVQAELPQFLGFALADTDGEIRCSSMMISEPLNISDRSYFKQAVESRRFVVGEFTRSKLDGSPSLPLALPTLDYDQTVTGVIVTGLNLDWLGRRLRERNLAEGSSITVADRDGVIIAREPFPERFVGMRIPDAFQHLVQASQPGSLVVVSQDGTRRVLGYYPPATTGANLYVSVGLSTDTAFGAITTSTYQSIIIAVIGAAAVFMIAWIAGEQLFRKPIGRLLNTVAAWRRGQDTARTGLAGDGSELAVLATAIDDYMDKLAADRAARRQAEEHRTLLVRELDHRVKNILTTVQAIATQSFRNERSHALEVFSGRLAAMANTHELLMKDNWATAEIRTTLETAIKPFEEEGRERFSLNGPALFVRARAALALSMAVHELCTNAVKYGALRMDTGHVIVEWAIQTRPDGDVFVFSWVERGGPLVKQPKRTGFGTRMIERALAAELSAKAELSFPSAGLVCTVECAVSSVLGESAGVSAEKAA